MSVQEKIAYKTLRDAKENRVTSVKNFFIPEALLSGIQNASVRAEKIITDNSMQLRIYIEAEDEYCITVEDRHKYTDCNLSVWINDIKNKRGENENDSRN